MRQFKIPAKVRAGDAIRAQAWNEMVDALHALQAECARLRVRGGAGIAVEESVGGTLVKLSRRGAPAVAEEGSEYLFPFKVSARWEYDDEGELSGCTISCDNGKIAGRSSLGGFLGGTRAASKEIGLDDGSGVYIVYVNGLDRMDYPFRQTVFHWENVEDDGTLATRYYNIVMRELCRIEGEMYHQLNLIQGRYMSLGHVSIDKYDPADFKTSEYDTTNVSDRGVILSDVKFKFPIARVTIDFETRTKHVYQIWEGPITESINS